MNVTGWTYFGNPKYKEVPDEVFDDVMDLVINEVRTKGYKLTGCDHQYAYCPVIDNKYLFGVSMRKWGEVMQKAYDLPNNDGLGYVYWAWSRPENEEAAYPKDCEKRL